MTKRGFALPLVVVFVLVVALVLAMWFTSRRNEGLNTFEVASDDAKVALTIPRGSLPKGVSEKDIAVKRTANQDDEGVLVYELIPGGLTLSQPATVKINVDSGGFIPVISHLSGEDFLPIENVEVIMEAAGKTKISAELSHFSSLVVTLGFFNVDITGPILPVNVADSFLVRAKIKNTGNILTIVLDDGVIVKDYISRTSSVQGKFIVDQASEVVGPTLVESRPNLTTLEAFDSVSTEETFFAEKKVFPWSALRLA